MRESLSDVGGASQRLARALAQNAKRCPIWIAPVTPTSRRSTETPSMAKRQRGGWSRRGVPASRRDAPPPRAARPSLSARRGPPPPPPPPPPFPPPFPPPPPLLPLSPPSHSPPTGPFPFFSHLLSLPLGPSPFASSTTSLALPRSSRASPLPTTPSRRVPAFSSSFTPPFPSPPLSCSSPPPLPSPCRLPLLFPPSFPLLPGRVPCGLRPRRGGGEVATPSPPLATPFSPPRGANPL